MTERGEILNFGMNQVKSQALRVPEDSRRLRYDYDHGWCCLSGTSECRNGAREATAMKSLLNSPFDAGSGRRGSLLVQRSGGAGPGMQGAGGPSDGGGICAFTLSYIAGLQHNSNGRVHGAHPGRPGCRWAHDRPGPTTPPVLSERLVLRHQLQLVHVLSLEPC